MTYDLIIIGAGPAGYEAASFAASKNMKVALIEKKHVGGTCLNEGCIPTKTLLHDVSTSKNLNEMQLHKQAVIETLQSSIEKKLIKDKVDLIKGEAIILAKGKVKVMDTIYETKYILIATGSKPVKLNIDGIEHITPLYSEDLLENTKPIQHLVIVGGGVIGCEFAALYQKLDTKVTIVEIASQLLGNSDKEVAQSLKLQFKQNGIDVLLESKIVRIVDDKHMLIESKGETVELAFDQVLFATGRKASFSSLFKEDIIQASKYIEVNENYQTSVDTIYAAGDVIGQMQLAHVATCQAINAVCHMNKIPFIYDMNYIPSCIYTHPEIASVGLTLKQAQDLDFDAISIKVLTGANGKSLLSNQPRGFMKLIVESTSGKLLGAIFMCARATDMITQITQAMVNDLTVFDLQKVVYPHPTFNESLKECIQQAVEKIKK